MKERQALLLYSPYSYKFHPMCTTLYIRFIYFNFKTCLFLLVLLIILCPESFPENLLERLKMIWVCSNYFDACSSFTILQCIAIWGNLASFYFINWIFSALPSSGMYTIMFRLCRQPSYWTTVFVSISF